MRPCRPSKQQAKQIRSSICINPHQFTNKLSQNDDIWDTTQAAPADQVRNDDPPAAARVGNPQTDSSAKLPAASHAHRKVLKSPDPDTDFSTMLAFFARIRPHPPAHQRPIAPATARFGTHLPRLWASVGRSLGVFRGKPWHPLPCDDATGATGLFCPQSPGQQCGVPA